MYFRQNYSHSDKGLFINDVITFGGYPDPLPSLVIMGGGLYLLNATFCKRLPSQPHWSRGGLH